MKRLPTSAMIAASRWYARLAAGKPSSKDISAWNRWKAAAPEHQLAWQQLEAINDQFKQVSPEIGMATLSLPSQGRRQALKQLAVLCALGSLGWYGAKEKPWQEMLADHATDTGQQERITLADGTHIYLNTNSAIDIHYSDSERIVQLIKGEVLIETGHETKGIHRPFRVLTRHGAVTALGTRFDVRDDGERSKVSVFEGAVRIRPHKGAYEGLVLKAGESTDFTTSDIAPPRAARSTDAAWVKGFLVVYAMRLGDFVRELSRYRHGVLRCDPAVANLLISGSFSTGDTDAVLDTLLRTLPIRIETYTRYWTTVKPA